MTDAESERAFKKTVTEIVRGRTALQQDTRAEIVRLLNEAQAQIRTILAGQPTDYQRWSLPQLSAEITRTLTEFGDAAGAKISTAAGDAWTLGQALADKPIAAAGIRVAGILPMLDTRQLMAMRAFMTDRIKDIGLAAANKINAQMGLVVIGAQTPSDAIGGVRAILGEPSRARATTIVRTELSRAFAVAAQNRLAQQAALVKGLRKKWRRSQKNHPRPHHALADGQVQEVGDPYVLHPLGRPQVRMMFPHDPAATASETINCGCISVPTMMDWELATPARDPGGGMDMGPSVRELLAGGDRKAA